MGLPSLSNSSEGVAKNFIGTAKGYNTLRLASKLKNCFRPMPRVPIAIGIAPR
jgi:hypothetical protein